MRSKKVEVRTPWKLYESSMKRCRDEKYRSHARYLNGLQLMDAVVPQNHSFWVAIANLDWEDQDILLERLLALNPGQLQQMVMSVLENLK